MHTILYSIGTVFPIAMFAAAETLTLNKSILIPGGVVVSIVVAAFALGRKLQSFIDVQKATNERMGSLENEIREMEKWIADIPCKKNPSIFQEAIAKALNGKKGCL